MIVPVSFPKQLGGLSKRSGLLTLVQAGVKAAVYRKDSIGMDGVPSLDGYEVVTYREHEFSSYTLGGKSVITDRQFAYPSNEEFGRCAWAYGKYALKSAMRRFVKLEYGSAQAN